MGRYYFLSPHLKFLIRKPKMKLDWRQKLKLTDDTKKRIDAKHQN